MAESSITALIDRFELAGSFDREQIEALAGTWDRARLAGIVGCRWREGAD